MAKGVAGQYLINGATVQRALEGVRWALEASGFRVKDIRGDHQTGRLRAVWGGKLKAYLVGHLPFGKMVRSGKRLGAEVEARAQPGGVWLGLAVVPYMELLDRPEVFLLSQGIMEKLTDDSFSRDKFNEVTSRMGSAGMFTAAPSVAPAYPSAAAHPYATPPAYGLPRVAAPRQGGGLSAFLGFLIGAGLTTAIMMGWVTIADSNLLWVLILVGIPLISGFFARRAGMGALNGFMSLFLPVVGLAFYILAQGAALGPEGNSFAAALGLVGAIILVILSFVLGLVGLLFGAIGGGIGGRVFPRPLRR